MPILNAPGSLRVLPPCRLVAFHCPIEHSAAALWNDRGYVEMNFVQALAHCFKNYANPNGRASRAEFWYWQLFGLVVIASGEFLDLVVFSNGSSQIITSALSLLFFIPNYAVQIRRLHDVDRNGWWLFIGLTIIGFFFPLLYWACKRGTMGQNREDPLQSTVSAKNIELPQSFN